MRINIHQPRLCLILVCLVSSYLIYSLVYESFIIHLGISSTQKSSKLGVLEGRAVCLCMVVVQGFHIASVNSGQYIFLRKAQVQNVCK